MGGQLGSAWPLSFKNINSKNTSFLKFTVQSPGLYGHRIGLHCIQYPSGLLPHVQHITSENISSLISMAHRLRLYGPHICTQNSRYTLGFHFQSPALVFWNYHVVSRLTPLLVLLPLGDYTRAVNLIILASDSVQGLGYSAMSSRVHSPLHPKKWLPEEASFRCYAGLGTIGEKRLPQAYPFLCSYRWPIWDTLHTWWLVIKRLAMV